MNKKILLFSGVVGFFSVFFMMIIQSKTSTHHKSFKELKYTNPTLVTKISLSRNRHIKDTLPSFFKNYTNLEKLSLKDLYLMEIHPEIMGSWHRLETLDMSLTYLKTLPSSVQNCKNLRDVSLRLNKLTSLPKELFQLPNVEILSLGFNKLRALPSDVKCPASLRVLDLDNNPLDSLPSHFFDNENLSLENLSISFTNIQKFPESIRNLKKLKILYISKTQLSESYIQQLKQWFPDTAILY